jgi:hypothetical protein
MPLIDLKTNLKSLGYGSDRPDGGSSNQPYIQTSIPEEREVNSPDFLLRNGNSNLESSLNDSSRLTKYLFDNKSSNGLLFITKQQLLERQNVDVDDGINRIYNPLGTIFQAGALSIGWHINKQGFNFFRNGYYNGGRDGYYSFTNAQKSPEFLNEHFLNRLAASYLIKKTNETSTPNFFRVNKDEPNILLSYPGGPGSALGLGKTNIRIQNETGPIRNAPQKFQPSYTSELIYSNGYLTPNVKRPSVNYTYSPLTTPGLSNLALNAFNPFFDRTNSLNVEFFTFNISNILNRNENLTSSLNPNIKALKNDNGRAYRFSTRTTEKRPFINWGYPIFDNNSVSLVAFNDFRKIAPKSRNELKENLLPDDFDPSFALNRDTTPSPYDGANNVWTFSFKKTLEQPSKGQNQNTAFNVFSNANDFRSAINKEFDEPFLPSTDYSEFNREKTYQDSITTYYGNYGNGRRILNPNTAVSMDQNEVGVMGEDIVDFNFTLILNNNPSDAQNRLIDFKAYIESWQDGTQGEWNEIKYMGRAEKLYKYNGFSRAGSVTFLVPALSRGDMIANYHKLNALMWATAPSYSDSTAPVPGLMRGSIVNFTMGNYFRRMPCIIKSINYTEIDGMGWDINRTE